MSQRVGEFNSDQEPLMNIGAVSRLTGISRTTLRVWERRYDFPTPARTEGGHRLYSHDEVTRLQWVKQRVDEGMSISQVISTLRQAKPEEALPPDPALSAPLGAGHENVSTLRVFRERLLSALTKHDASQADQLLGELLAIVPLEMMLFEIISPVLHDLGEGWSEGRIDVATEHFASNHLRHHLLMWMRTGPPALPVDPVILACAPGELHEGSLLMLAVLLRRLRWPFIFLGQDMPLSEMGAFLEENRAAMVVFVAMTEEPARALADWPLHLPGATRARRPIVTYAGRAFNEQPELTTLVPGTFLGNTLQEGIATLDRMLHTINDASS